MSNNRNHIARQTTTAPAHRESEKTIRITGSNGHGISRSSYDVPAYAVEAARRVSPSSMVCYGD